MSNPKVDFMRIAIGFRMGEGNPISKVVAWLRPELTEVEEGRVVYKIIVEDDFLNPGKTLHGGVTACILDEIIGAAVYSLNKEFLYATINLNTNYLNAAQLGDVLLCEAKVVRNGTKVLYCEGTVKRESDDKIIAIASSNMGLTDRKVPI